MTVPITPLKLRRSVPWRGPDTALRVDQPTPPFGHPRHAVMVTPFQARRSAPDLRSGFGEHVPRETHMDPGRARHYPAGQLTTTLDAPTHVSRGTGPAPSERHTRPIAITRDLSPPRTPTEAVPRETGRANYGEGNPTRGLASRHRTRAATRFVSRGTIG